MSLFDLMFARINLIRNILPVPPGASKENIPHSALKLTLNIQITEPRTFNISKSSGMGSLQRNKVCCKKIEEQHRRGYNLDRTFQR
jgi:hypothetical protein